MAWIKAYKGFDKNMKCRGFQFAEGNEYEEENAKLCESGFHACETPVDCLKYYAPGCSVYREVELDATEEKHDKDSKRVGKKIKIGAEISIANMVKAHFEYVKAHCTDENNAVKGKAASAGYRGAASAGAYGAASAGAYGAASAGESGAASAGAYGAASAGYRGAACSRGSVAVKKNGVAVVRGNNVRAKGGLGSILVIAEESDRYDIAAWKAAVVDGEKIKADTWYKLENGEFVEVENA